MKYFNLIFNCFIGFVLKENEKNLYPSILSLDYRPLRRNYPEQLGALLRVFANIFFYFRNLPKLNIQSYSICKLSGLHPANKDSSM